MENQPPVSPEKTIDVLLAPVEELSKLLRLALGLSTGAVVLFLNLLNTAHARRGALAVLGAAIFSFGIAGTFCLRVLLRLVEARTVLSRGILEQMTTGESKTFDRLAAWQRKARRDSIVFAFFFDAGLFSAALFVLFLLVGR
jgi:hypothetical protein